MNQQEKKLYKKIPLSLIGFFICMLAILIFLNNPFAEDASLSLAYCVLLAFITSLFWTIGMVGSIKIMLPVTKKNYIDERLKVYKREHISLKLALLITSTITILFLTLWLTSPVSLSFLAQWVPLWQALIGGIVISILTSLLLIVLLKFYIKNNTKYEDGRNNRISFRGA